MSKNTENNQPPIDWTRADEIWCIAGFQTAALSESEFSNGGTPDWTAEDMDAVFLNKAKIQAEYDFQIKWDAFKKRHGARAFRLSRGELLEAILQFSKDENSIQATYDFYQYILEQLGVELADHGDDFSSP